MVDGLGVGDVGNVVLRDRHLLSKDGFVVVVVVVDADTGQVLGGPDIITRGFVYVRESGDLIDGAALCVLEALEDGPPRAAASAMIKDSLGGFFYEQTKRRPMILPVVMEM
jgi:ribonuclease J